MKVSPFLFVLVVSIQVGFSQSKEDRNGNLIGYVNKEDFLNGTRKIWFEKNYNSYQPSKRIVEKIKKNSAGVSIIAFAGSWCHDSKRVLPRFYKIMEQAEFDLKNNFTLIGLTRGKKTPDNLQEGYNIKNTPTFIFYKEGNELARFVEHSVKTMERDILQILSEKRYKHPYQTQ